MNKKLIGLSVAVGTCVLIPSLFFASRPTTDKRPEPAPLTAEQVAIKEGIQRARDERAAAAAISDTEARKAAERILLETIVAKCENGYKVVDVTKTGCRILALDSRGRPDYDHDAFIEGLDGLSDRTYEGPLMVVRNGEMRYKTVLGATRVIPSFRVAPENLVAMKKAAEREEQKNRDAEVARQAAAKRESDARIRAAKAEHAAVERESKKAQTEAKVVQALQSRIDSGSADAAWELGQRYLEGNGVPVDPKKAESLFEIAATRGHQKAKEWFATKAQRLQP